METISSLEEHIKEGRGREGGKEERRWIYARIYIFITELFLYYTTQHMNTM